VELCAPPGLRNFLPLAADSYVAQQRHLYTFSLHSLHYGASSPMAKSTSEPRLIRLPEVIRRTGMSKSTIYARIAQNDFPKQKVLSPRLVVWLEADVTKWIEQTD
jgi:prophage regulatory protein